MPQVNVLVNGRPYTVACAEGEERHVQALANAFDRRVQASKRRRRRPRKSSKFARTAPPMRWKAPRSGSKPLPHACRTPKLGTGRVLLRASGMRCPGALMVLTGSCPWPGSWSWSYGAHLHLQAREDPTPTAVAVPSASPSRCRFIFSE
jgi:hypothetical protein